MDGLDNWQRNHAVVGGIFIVLATFGLWAMTGMSLEAAMNSSIPEFGAVFYGGLVGFFEGGGMFYAIAKMRQKERESKAAGRDSMVAELEDVATEEEAEMLRNLLRRINRDTNGETGK